MTRTRQACWPCQLTMIAAPELSLTAPAAASAAPAGPGLVEAGLGRSAADMQGRAAGLATGGRADTEMAAGGLTGTAMEATMARRQGEWRSGLAGQWPGALVLAVGAAY